MSYNTYNAEAEMVTLCKSVFDETRYGEDIFLTEIKRSYEFRENIIRCRDCDYQRYDAKYCGLHECFDDDDPGIGLVPVNPDGFCAWAEAVG